MVNTATALQVLLKVDNKKSIYKIAQSINKRYNTIHALCKELKRLRYIRTKDNKVFLAHRGNQLMKDINNKKTYINFILLNNNIVGKGKTGNQSRINKQVK